MESFSAMNDHNLDDLIIDTHTTKNAKMKGFLTIIALLIIVLIVAIILTKIILKDPDTNQDELMESNKEMISPELTLQDHTDEKSDENNAFSEMIESGPEVPDTEEIAKAIVVTEEEKHKATAPKNVPDATKPNADSRKEIVKLPIDPTPKPTIKKTPPSAKPIVTKVPKQTATLNGETFYIQVGSFSKTPDRNSRLISAIRKNGYHYRIITAPNGMKKVLIGPYRSRPAVDKAIIRVKDRINKNAFVFKQ
jgi:DedD protein